MGDGILFGFRLTARVPGYNRRGKEGNDGTRRGTESQRVQRERQDSLECTTRKVDPGGKGVERGPTPSMTKLRDGLCSEVSLEEKDKR